MTLWSVILAAGCVRCPVGVLAVSGSCVCTLCPGVGGAASFCSWAGRSAHPPAGSRPESGQADGQELR
eukprot:5699376-Alexandrium_andersonii.AAC.1